MNPTELSKVVYEHLAAVCTARGPKKETNRYEMALVPTTDNSKEYRFRLDDGREVRVSVAAWIYPDPAKREASKVLAKLSNAELEALRAML